MVLSYLFAAVLLSLLLAAATHYLYGGLRPAAARHARARPPRAPSCSCSFGFFVLLKAVAYWVDRYGIDFSQRGAVRPVPRTPTSTRCCRPRPCSRSSRVICALLFFAGAARRSSMLPAIGFGLLVLSAILIGGVYPAIIQQFVVKPNELVKETPYIKREIASTRQPTA